MRRRITVSLTEKMADRLEAAVEVRGLSISQIVNAALDQYLKSQEVQHG